MIDCLLCISLQLKHLRSATSCWEHALDIGEFVLIKRALCLKINFGILKVISNLQLSQNKNMSENDKIQEDLLNPIWDEMKFYEGWY